MTEFTPAQRQAIEETGKTLLVSAAAGSGKTTTLIERILQSVCRAENPIPLDRLLIVTFTRAAAGELRARISRALARALEENGGDTFLQRQISLLPSAKICTIDSYCLDLVRANFASLGLSPAFRIADEGEARLIARRTMETLIDDCCDNPESTVCGGAAGFAGLLEMLLGTGSDERAADLFLSLYEKLESDPRGASALLDCARDLAAFAKTDFFSSPPGARIEHMLCAMFEHYRTAYKLALDKIHCDERLSKAYGPAFEGDFAGILHAAEALKSGFAEASEAILGIEFQKLGAYRKKDMPPDGFDFVRALREDYKKEIKEIRAAYFSVSPEATKKCLRATAEVCRGAADLLLEYERRAAEEKKRRNVCDFSDISRYTLMLLVDENGQDTPLARAQKSAFDAVYIDEYQDVNAVQDRIFRAISTKNNRFMVGDIKQSIYAFRGAEPSIFAGMRRAYPELSEAKDSPCATLYMRENFRCSKPVIDFTNQIFDRLMPLVSKGTGYTESDALVFGKRTAPGAAPAPVTVALCERPPKEERTEENKRPEAEYIAAEILRLAASETKEDGTAVRFGDIAILLRSMKGSGDMLAAKLRAAGIPVRTETSTDLLGESEIELLLCLLGAIDNPRRDISLCGVMLSPLFGFDCDFLSALRKDAKDERLYTTLRRWFEAGENAPENPDRIKTKRLLDTLSYYRSLARFCPVGELLTAIYTEMNLYAVLAGKSPLRRANLKKFLAAAQSFAGGAYRNLSEFLQYIETIQNDAKHPLTSAKPETEGSDAVKIMSIHQSKGLEFPVVFLAGAAKKYNLMDADAPLLYSADCGFSLMLRDDSGFCVYDNPVRRSAALHIRQKAKEEELRLLYVALTRARERLYVTADADDPEKLLGDAGLEQLLCTEYASLSKTDYLSLILQATGGAETPALRFTAVPFEKTRANSAFPPAEENAPEAVPGTPADPDEETAAEALRARFAFRYPHKARTKIPAKLSISLLYPGLLDDETAERSIGAQKLPAQKEAPEFLAKESEDAARRGTATHLFMQFFNFENAAKNGAEAELRRLASLGFLSREDAALVRTDEIKRFLESDLFAKMRAAKTLYREQRFNLEMEAAQFAEDAKLRTELAGEQVLVQGVIDCFFEDSDGDITLVDYKTDRVFGAGAEERLLRAHGAQLSYYARAIEQICGRPVRRALIYSLCLGRAIEADITTVNIPRGRE